MFIKDKIKIIFIVLMVLYSLTDAQMTNAQIVLGEPDAVTKYVELREVKQVENLIKAGQSPNAVNADGIPLLSIAARNNDEAMVDLLLNFNASINGKDRTGRTALHWASAYANDNIIERLVAAGVELNIINNNGETALILAAKAGDMLIINQLLGHGADAAIYDFTGRNAHDWAQISRNPNSANLLP